MKRKLLKLIISMILPSIVYIIFLISSFERFANWDCIYTIFLQSIIPSIIAYAYTYIYISGLFDFTIGSRIIISGLAGGIAANWFGVPGLLIGAFMVSILLALITGILNWISKIPSLILTMALTMIYEILGKNISGKFSFVSIEHKYAMLGASPYIVVVFAFSSLLFYFIFNYTKLSCHIKAVGSNELAAKNTGIKTNYVKCMCFIIGSIFIAISAVLTISQSGSMGAQTNLGSATLLFKPLMGIIIAVAMQPVCDMTFGIFISQFTLNTIFIGLIATGLSDTFQNVALGIFLLIVMVFSNSIGGFGILIKKFNTNYFTLKKEETV